MMPAGNKASLASPVSWKSECPNAIWDSCGALTLNPQTSQRTAEFHTAVSLSPACVCVHQARAEPAGPRV